MQITFKINDLGVVKEHFWYTRPDVILVSLVVLKMPLVITTSKQEPKDSGNDLITNDWRKRP